MKRNARKKQLRVELFSKTLIFDELLSLSTFTAVKCRSVPLIQLPIWLHEKNSLLPGAHELLLLPFFISGLSFHFINARVNRDNTQVVALTGASLLQSSGKCPLGTKGA